MPLLIVVACPSCSEIGMAAGTGEEGEEEEEERGRRGGGGVESTLIFRRVTRAASVEA